MAKTNAARAAARAALQSANQNKAVIWSTGVAAVIVVGTLTGATLKQDKQKEEAIMQFRDTSPTQQIKALQEHKKSLVDQRAELQRKLDLFHERVQEREVEKQKKRERAAAEMQARRSQ